MLFLSSLLLTALAGPSDMINVHDVAPTVVVDMRYATGDNFLGYAFYTGPEADICWLTPNTAKKVAEAERIVAAQGYHLVLYDCARPLPYQYTMWDTCVSHHGTGHCSGLVANPYNRPSGHTYGQVVDLGLVAADGTEIELPSKYDSGLFPGDTSLDKARARPPAGSAPRGNTPWTHPNTWVCPSTWTPQAMEHYKVMASALHEAGFHGAITSEWWHWR